MDITSVKYEVHNTAITQNTNFIHSKFIQDTMIQILRTFAQVYAGCPYPMAMHDSGSLSYIKASVCNNNTKNNNIKDITFQMKHKIDSQTKLATTKSTRNLI